jgi:presqualene diphosphate synthase
MTSLTLPQTAQHAMALRVKKAGTSFAAGMAALPPERRSAMHALYAFCRVVDDIADDLPSFAEREAGLNQWRGWISALFQHGTVHDEITAALLPAIAAFGLVEADFQTIIDGMAMDAGAPMVAPDAATLDLYCDRVASAVGRVSVRIFGDASNAAMQVAEHLGRALQLTNILRDLHEDAERGRLYLPREILLAQELPPDLSCLQHPKLPAVCRIVAAQATRQFTLAEQAMAQCERRAMLPARLMGAYYAAILRRLIAADWQDVTRRIRLPLWQKLWLMLSQRCAG